MKVNSNRKFWLYFFIVLISLPLLGFIYFSFVTTETWGVNKTVGWQWDISNVLFWVGGLSLIVIFLCLVTIVAFLLMRLVQFLRKNILH